MGKPLKKRILQYLWDHSRRNKPMIPQGTVDTSALNDHITAPAFRSLFYTGADLPGAEVNQEGIWE